ncbi:major facilitator superfamily domain-containing protein [Trichophaea hybrida]|nr:major facilitator superfamily domain-containing protein [Trichophaea hybrida]
MAATTVFEDKASVHTLGELPALSPSLSQSSTIYCTSENSKPYSTSKKSYCTSEKPSQVDLERDDKYPEGGKRAWSVVLGSFLCMAASFGMMNTIGTLQAHLSKNQLAHYSDGEIGWIFGVYTFLSFFCGILIGPIFDAFGPEWLLRFGTLFLVAGSMLVSVSTLYWHFMLSFGIFAGIGTSLIITPAVASIGHWFRLKRAYATGVATTGGSIGGIILPLIIKGAIPTVGFAWAMRTVGFVQFFLLFCGNFLVRTRTDIINGTDVDSIKTSEDLKKNQPGPGRLRSAISAIRIDIKAFLDPRFTFTTISVFFIEWAIFVPLTYITSYALNLGLSSDLSYQLIVVLNIGSVFGRWLPGFVADKMGRFNTMIVTVCFCFATVLSLWIPSGYIDSVVGRKAIMIVFALLYGFGSGSGISLTGVCIGQICSTKEYGTKFGTCYCFVSLGTLTGIPIAGQIVAASGGGYLGLICFAGASYICAFIFFNAARWVGLGIEGKKRGWRAVY